MQAEPSFLQFSLHGFVFHLPAVTASESCFNPSLLLTALQHPPNSSYILSPLFSLSLVQWCHAHSVTHSADHPQYKVGDVLWSHLTSVTDCMFKWNDREATESQDGGSSIHSSFSQPSGKLQRLLQVQQLLAALSARSDQHWSTCIDTCQ